MNLKEWLLLPLGFVIAYIIVLFKAAEHSDGRRRVITKQDLEKKGTEPLTRAGPLL